MEFENIITLIKTISDSKLTEFTYEKDGTNIQLKKEAVIKNVMEVQPMSSGTEQMVTLSYDNKNEKESKTDGNLICSPLVGTFYEAPAEDAEPFVVLGDTVTKGQTLAIVEAMKLMNEIESDFDGKIAEIYVKNGQAVEYGQPLFRII